MEGDTGHRPALDADASSHTNELKLVNIDTSGEQASSPTCPLNLLVRSPLSGKADLELSDPFMIGTNNTAGVGGGGGGGDRPVPTDELVDFREKGSREADGSGRGDDYDLVLIGDDALEQLTGEADMDNIFQEALALADQFSRLDKLDDADVSLVDSAPQSLPGESELLSLDSAMLAALAEARRQQPPNRALPLPDSPLDSSFPTPTIPSAVSSLRSASAAAVAQAAAASAGNLTPPGSTPRPGDVLGDQSKAPAPAPTPAPAPAPAAVSQSSPTPRPTGSAAQRPETDPEPAVAADASAVPAGPTTDSGTATPSRLADRQRDSLAVASRRRLVAPAASVPAPAAAPAPAPTPPPPPPPPADDAGYADLCQQASAEQRELERQADEEYENRQFEHLERRVSREDILDTDPEPGQDTDPDPELDSTDGKRQSRSQLSRKETYICRPNTGTFRIDKRQRFGTYKVDKTGTFKVPRASASAARSLPPEPAPEPVSDASSSAAAGLDGEPETAAAPEGEARTDTPTSDMNGGVDLPSDSVNNTFCPYSDDFGERSPSPSHEPLSASTPERGDQAGPAAAAAAAGRRAAGLRRPVTSTPCRSVGSSGSSIGLTPIRGPPVDESPVPAPVAALRGPGLRQPAAGSAAPAPAQTGLRRPAASGLRQPAASGLRQPAASGLRQPVASGLRQPAASGLRRPAASGLRQPAASGLRQPAASSGLRPPSASGLRAPSAAGAPRSAPARQPATQLRQSSAQSGSDSSVCSVRSLPGPNTSRSNPSLVSDRCDTEPAPTQRQPRQLPGPASRQPARGGGVRRSAGATGSLTNISLQASHSAAASGLRRPAAGRNRHQETSKLSLSQQPAGSERF